jgi:Ca2+/H+ antiporter
VTRGKFLFAWVGWSNRQWVLFLLVLFVFVVTMLVALAMGVPDPHLNNWLLLLSGIVVLLYTVETQGLRMEMVRQNEIAIQPVVIALIEERSGGTVSETRSRQQLVLRNVGRGTALFIKVQDVT